MGERDCEQQHVQSALTTMGGTLKNIKKIRTHSESDPGKNLWEPSTELLKETSRWKAIIVMLFCYSIGFLWQLFANQPTKTNQNPGDIELFSLFRSIC